MKFYRLSLVVLTLALALFLSAAFSAPPAARQIRRRKCSLSGAGMIFSPTPSLNTKKRILRSRLTTP